LRWQFEDSVDERRSLPQQQHHLQPAPPLPLPQQQKPPPKREVIEKQAGPSQNTDWLEKHRQKI